MGRKKLEFLRITGTEHSKKGGQKYHLMELEAYTRDYVPDLSRNLALFSHGGKVVSSSVKNDKPRNLVQLINGSDSIWKTGAAFPHELFSSFIDKLSAT